MTRQTSIALTGADQLLVGIISSDLHDYRLRRTNQGNFENSLTGSANKNCTMLNSRNLDEDDNPTADLYQKIVECA